MNIRGRIIGRILVLTILVMALVDPRLPWRQAPVDILVLVDESVGRDVLPDPSRWQALRSELARLPDGSRFSVIRFGADNVLETGYRSVAAGVPQAIPRTRPLDRSASNIEDAVRAGLQQIEPGRTAAMVLIGDGRETVGDAAAALRLAADAAVPVFDAVRGSPDVFEGEVRILEFEVPARVRLGQRVPVEVTLAARRGRSVRLSVFLDGRLQATEALALGDGDRRHVGFQLVPAAPGVGRVELVVEHEGEGQPLRRVAVVEVEAAPPVLYVGVPDELPDTAASLLAGGWPVRYAGPHALSPALDDGPQVVVLDDLAVADLPDAAWHSLERRVREQGVGLIVLGGPRSFGRGGYRHSRLESLLPVVSEAVRPQPPAAVLFVVDKSGSMDRNEGGVSRFALARQAVVETARRLSADDRAGLLAFDVEPRWVVELDRHADPASTIESAWTMAPGGGTRLDEALREAVGALGRAPDDMRLLVLVTDGLIGEAGLEDLAPLFVRSGVRLLAVVVDDGADPAVLRSMAEAHGGSVMSVGNLMTLPRLMPALVGQQRAMTEAAELVEIVEPLPFAIPGPWPRVDAYALTRPRPRASVFLRSEHGDPLLAGWPAGAGWVLALPGGLGGWAPAWRDWVHSGVLLGGLVEWASAHHSSAWLDLRAEHLPGRLRIVLDAVTDDREWLLDEKATFVVQDPVGRTIELEAKMQAPGRYNAELAALQPGPYRIGAQAGSQRAWRDAHRLPFATVDAVDRREDWIGKGLLRSWPEAGLADATATRTGVSSRGVLATLGALAYLALMAYERGLWSLPRRALQSASRSWRARFHRSRGSIHSTARAETTRKATT